ncbi:MAG: arylesterase [Rhodospirillales bacterium]
MRRLFNVLFAAILLAGATAALPAAAEPQRLLVLGDSLTAGYGLNQGKGFTDQLGDALAAAGDNVIVINGGVSGDTSAGGAGRIGWLLADKPDAAIVELGANDALRGLDPADTKRHLARIIDELKAAGIEVLLAGMLAPPNLGRDYGAAFNAIYPDLAEEKGVALYPFFLDGVAAEPALNQDDGIHPNERGVAVIVERILPAVRRLLASARGAGG